MGHPKPAPSSPAVQEHATGLLKHWLSVSESQICALEVLRTQLPEVDALLNDSFTDISGRFVQLAEDFQQYKTMDQTSEAAQALSAEISQTIGGIITGMQFQDRVSQNLVITVNVLNAIVAYLQEEIDETISELDEQKQRAKLDEDFARELIGLLNLGELQHKFVHHLVEHGYITDPAQLGISPDKAQREDDDNIDLF